MLLTPFRTFTIGKKSPPTLLVAIFFDGGLSCLRELCLQSQFPGRAPACLDCLRSEPRDELRLGIEQPHAADFLQAAKAFAERLQLAYGDVGFAESRR